MIFYLTSATNWRRFEFILHRELIINPLKTLYYGNKNIKQRVHAENINLQVHAFGTKSSASKCTNLLPRLRHNTNNLCHTRRQRSSYGRLKRTLFLNYDIQRITRQ